MGKARRNVKALLAKRTTGQLNRMLDDETNEQVTLTYDNKDRNKKLAFVLRMRDAEIERERRLSKSRQCPKCYVDGCNGECDEYLVRAKMKLGRK